MLGCREAPNPSGEIHMMNLARTLALSTLLVTAALIGSARAQETLKPDEIAKIKTDVLVTMNAYFTAFNERDTQKIATGLFSNPSMTMGPAGVSANTPDQVAKQYAGNIQKLADAGWDKSVMLHYEVCLMNPNLAFAHGTFNRIRKDGSILQAGASTYMLNKGKDGWRIVMLIPHDKTKVMTCND
jgi:hypothetical protein